MSFESAFQQVVMVEGGYVNDPNDSGGKTRYGITERVARANGYQGNMRELPLQDARDIYWRQYWEPLGLPGICSLSSAIAHELFDSAVNTGVPRAATWLQRALNALNYHGSLYADMAVDGVSGPVTHAALSDYLAHRGHEGETVMLRALNGLQAAFYIELAERRVKDEAFLYGWLRTRIEMP